MKSLITGASGLLGQELSDILPDAFAYSHEGLDVGDAHNVWRVLTHRKIDVVFHCAAMSDVDVCESNPAQARRVNAVGAYNVASVCSSLRIHLVALSTDYVFDGKPGRELREDSLPKPVSVYGKTKLEGEMAIRGVDPSAAIVRTSWLYGRGRPTFIDSVISRGRAGQTMEISRSQTSSPTWAAALAPALVQLARRRCEGVFHLTNDGSAARDEWARVALEAGGYDSMLVHAVDTFPAAARRPRFSALSNTRARSIGVSLPPWRESVKAYVQLNGSRATENSA